jgi:hypothetical protein
VRRCKAGLGTHNEFLQDRISKLASNLRLELSSERYSERVWVNQIHGPLFLNKSQIWICYAADFDLITYMKSNSKLT